MGEVTEMLNAINADDASAWERLVPVVYDELRQIARHKLVGGGNNQTLQTTALVHEAYLRLVGSGYEAKGRSHFFAAAAEAMRRILVERARQKNSLKRGRDKQRVELDGVAPHIEPPADEVLNLHAALDVFAVKYPAKADLVKLRYFAGFTTSEAAEALGITTRTAERYWRFAKAWLFEEVKR